MYPGSGSKLEDPLSRQTTPPLVFTTQLARTPPQAQNSPSLQPLHVGSYSAVVGLQRRPSNLQLMIDDSPIKVTCCTRDGNRSPYVNPAPPDMLLDGELSISHPYSHSFSYSAPSTPIHTPHLQNSDFAHTGTLHQLHHTAEMTVPVPPQQVEQSTTAQDYSGQGSWPAVKPKNALPSGVVHRALEGRCRFIAFPPHITADENGTTTGGGNNKNNGRSTGGVDHSIRNLPALFIGQVRFETTSAELIWLVQRICGACASHLEGRGAGCYLLYCKSEADLPLVRSLHKRVLFDVGGVWLARTAEEVDALCEYVALDASLLSRSARLPRDSMVVEELKVDAIGGAHHRRGGEMGSHGHAMSPLPQYVSYPHAAAPPATQQYVFGGSSYGMYCPYQQAPPAFPPPYM